ncbi:MAG: metallophosphoesterase [Calditrichaeota bacterium]|nr:metallophosphoesterase [Calditrichota bacterium]
MKFPVDKEKRLIWSIARSCLENNKFKHKRFGGKQKSYWTLFERFVRFGSFFLKIGPFYGIGNDNSKNIIVNRIDVPAPHCPDAFDGYKILHLSDLHLDCVKGLDDIICDRLQNLSCDLCVITGDYREKTHGGYKQILGPLQKIINSIHARDGILSVLGNHDTYLMVPDFEKMGIRMLTNETVQIQRGNACISITGLDDPSTYYTDAALRALEEEKDGCKIVLVHSPELYDVASVNGYKLYLCGHTHGGQICLPGGIPLVTHLKTGKKFFRGLWQYNGMAGYTSQGCGASGIPVRFNTTSEITLLTLSRHR